MDDEGFSAANQVMDVPRLADLDTIEATFAKLYKAARRYPNSDQRRAKLNAALEVLRDVDKRAQQVMESFWAPLDGNSVAPSAARLAAQLLTAEVESRDGVDENVLMAAPEQIAEQLVNQQERPKAPDESTTLRQMAARATLEMLDPWKKTGA